MGKIIGIDLGTSNSAAAALKDGKSIIIPSADGTTVGGGKAFPSVVAFTEDGQLIVGELARQKMISNLERTVSEVKRKMGTFFKFDVFGKEYTPQQVSAFILKKIKKDAEAYLGETVDRAVITVPARFNDNERQATKDAGKIAGLQVIRVINEPTAASLAYGLDKIQKNLKIMIFDLGGGTLDVTIMEIRGGVFRVISTSGDTKLGGIDMDKLLSDHIILEFKKQSGLDVRNDKKAIARIREEAEKAKIRLSNLTITDINLPFIAKDDQGNTKDLELSITRAKLEELLSPIIERCRSPLMQALQDAELSASNIDKIILIGGASRMPKVREFVAAVMERELEGGIDPMEAVAIGAAIQGSMLSGEITGISLVDVLPLTLGIEVLGGSVYQDGSVYPIIERNTAIPIKKSKIFTTPDDNTTTIKIHVIQGESPFAYDCVSLGMFNLSIPPAPSDEPQIEVTFDIDASGILNVTAKDLDTLTEAKITITSGVALTKVEIDEAQEELKYLDKLDEWKKREAEIKNEADSLIHISNNLLREYLKGKTKSEQVKRLKKSIEKFIDELKDAAGSKKIPKMDIKTKIQQLTRRDAIGSEKLDEDIKTKIEDIKTKIQGLNSIIVNEFNQYVLKEYYGNSHAIIIGISKYKEETPLANAYNDALAIEKVLKEKYGFNILTSLYNENATAENITHIFTDILQDKDIIGSKDRVLIYYSGHGKLRTILNRQAQEIKQGFIVPHDSNKEKYNLNVPMETVVDGCQNCAAKHVLLILDCCYSGLAAIRSGEQQKPKKVSQFYLKEIASRSATQVLAAGQEDQAVSDSGKRPGYSAFTGALLDILDMERDLDDDGILTASEIGYNMGKEVISHQKGVYQKPVYNHIAGSEGGDFIFKLFDISMLSH